MDEARTDAKETAMTTDVKDGTRGFIERLFAKSQARARDGHTQVTREESPTALSESSRQIAVAATFDLDSDSATLSAHETSVIVHDEGEQPPSRVKMGNRYIELGVLGIGGMGQVLRVHDTLLNRVLAMKILHERLLNHEGSVLRFIQEAQVGAQLQHPNILPVYELGIHESGHVYFTMAEIIGHSLAKFIHDVHQAVKDGQWQQTESGWNLHRLVSAFRDICNAMSYAHRHGVVHRDLKPQNVMVGRFGEVLVVDWGIAKVLQSDEQEDIVSTMRSQSKAHQTVLGTMTGTPAYMAPEQALGRAFEANAKADIYTLGVILYEVLRGHPAYQGDETFEVLDKVVAGARKSFLSYSDQPIHKSSDSSPQELDSVIVSATPVSGMGAPVPQLLVDVCDRAMKRDPKDRFHSVEEMGAIVGQWLDGSKRRESALALVSQADQLNQDVERAQHEASMLEEEAARVTKTIEPWKGEEAKAYLWRIEDHAIRLRTDALIKQTEQTQLLRASLAHKDDLFEAHAALARHYLAMHRNAESKGNLSETERAAVVLREHMSALPASSELKAECLRYLDGAGTLNLQSTPEGATVLLGRLITLNRRLTPKAPKSLGHTPLRNVRIERGSYLLILRRPGFHDTIYPVYNRRLEDINTIASSGEANPITLLPEGTLGIDDCYVPAGWCWLGGDGGTPNSLPRTRVWIDGFVIRRFSVTHHEYIQFLNALVASGDHESAGQHVPREQSSREGERGVMAYRQLSDGTFALPLDPARDICQPGQPVTMIQWKSARAYAAWHAEMTGLPWRLPMEFEWEKAARGVDGRYYPWGNAFDPSWCCMKDSHRGEVRMQNVDSFPIDESVYGVRGTAGNTRDWCLDKFRETGPPLEDGRLLMPSEADLADTGFKSTRGGSYGNSPSRARSADRDWWFPERSYVGRGFRLAWGIADWRRSEN